MANQEFTDFEVSVNLDEVAAWGGEASDPPPPGDYQMLISNVVQKNSNTSNKPMVAVTFDLVAGADGSALADEARGKKAYNNYMLDNTTGLGRLKALMIAAGASLDKVRGSELMGVTIRATVTHTKGNDLIDENGNVKPGKVFANVINETALEQTQTAQATKTTANPPIMNKGAPAKNGTGARRA